jgi:hypothetical protein
MLFLAFLSLCDAQRVVKSFQGDKSVVVASFAKDPATVGTNNVLLMSMGSKGVFGNMPPHVFVAFVNGSVAPDMLGDAANLYNKRVEVSDAKALLFAHWGIGEWCDMDGKAGFGGKWPPNFASLASAALQIALSKDRFAEDTFLTAAGWEQAVFDNIKTGKNEAGASFAEINTVAASGKQPVFSMQCRAGDAIFGDFKFKCDFAIRFDGLWVDQVAKPDLLPLVGNLKADDAITQNKGCGYEKRKLALLAFLAGASVKSEAEPDGRLPNWQKVPIGDAEFAYISTVNIVAADGKDTGKTSKVTAQIQPVSDIVDTSKWPPFLKESRAILFTFDASREDAWGVAVLRSYTRLRGRSRHSGQRRRFSDADAQAQGEQHRHRLCKLHSVCLCDLGGRCCSPPLLRAED